MSTPTPEMIEMLNNLAEDLANILNKFVQSKMDIASNVKFAMMDAALTATVCAFIMNASKKGEEFTNVELFSKAVKEGIAKKIRDDALKIPD